MKKLLILIAILSLLLQVACTTTSGGRRNIEESVIIDKSLTEVPESRLLNASIEVFDPGALPEDEKEANGHVDPVVESSLRHCRFSYYR